MTEREPKSLQNLNLVDRFLFDQVMEAPGAYQTMVNILLENKATPFNLFGRGLYRYTFNGVCEECPDLRINDGAVRVFINTKGTDREAFTQEFLDFMEYLTDTSEERAAATESIRIRELHREIQKIRASEEMGVKYMQKWEERVYDRMDGKEEGLAEGLAKGLTEGEVKGKSNINRLIQALIRDNRLDDLVRSTADSEFQERLLKEYHIGA